MVRAGPQMVLGRLEKTLGHFSIAQKSQILTELKSEEKTNHDLMILKNIIKSGAHSDNILARLDKRSSFEVPSNSECAQWK